MTNIKHEDAIMKMGFDYFRDNILKILGIAYEFIDVSPTELIEIRKNRRYVICAG